MAHIQRLHLAIMQGEEGRLAQPLGDQLAGAIDQLRQVGAKRDMPAAAGIGARGGGNLGHLEIDGTTRLLEVGGDDGPCGDIDLQQAITAHKLGSLAGRERQEARLHGQGTGGWGRGLGGPAGPFTGRILGSCGFGWLAEVASVLGLK